MITSGQIEELIELLDFYERCITKLHAIAFENKIIIWHVQQGRTKSLTLSHKTYTFPFYQNQTHGCQ